MKYKLALLALTFLILSCSQANTQVPPKIPQQTLLTKEPTILIALSPTYTLTPEMAKFEDALTSSPSKQKILYLIENPLCDLPCWWNMVPGETGWDYVRKAFQKLGETPLLYENSGGYSSYDATYYIPDSVNFVNFRFYTKNNILEFISIDSFLDDEDFRSTYKQYNPKNIIDKYGIPSRIYLRIYDVNTINYSMYFFYDNENFLIAYGGVAVSSKNSEVVICPNTIKKGVTGISIYSQSNKIETPIDYFPGEKKIFDIDRSSWVTITNATNLTAAEFSTLISASSDSCFTSKR